MGAVKFVQFLMPRGERRLCEIDMPDKETRHAEMLVKIGAKFEMELLRDYKTVSFEIAAPIGNEPFVSLAMELVENGPKVPDTVAKLINRAYGRALECGLFKEVFQ